MHEIYIKVSIYIFLLLFINKKVNAQEALSKLDSLQLELTTYTTDDSNKVVCLETIALHYSMQSPDSAIRYATMAYEISNKLNYKSGILTSLRQLGAFHLNKNDYIPAVNYLTQALSAGKKYNEPSYTASIQSNLGMLYLYVEDYSKALSYFLLAKPELKKSKETYVEAYLYNNIGLTYLYLKEYTAALRYIDTALQLANTLQLTEVIATCHLNLGIISKIENDIPKALLNFDKAFEYANADNNEYVKAEALGGLAEVNFAQKQYGKAEHYAFKSLAVSRGSGFLNAQRDMYKLQVDVYTAQNKLTDAYAAYRNYITLRDSIINADKKTEILRNELQQTFNEKEYSIVEASNKSKLEAAKEILRQATMRKWTTIVAIALISLLILFIYIYKKRRDLIEKQQESELKSEIAETELKALRAQMNPHFIFNSLNSISHFINTHSTQSADDYIASFAKLMRLTLELSEERIISLEQELEHLKLYLKLEQQRLDNRFQFAIHIAPNVNTAEWMIPSLILQPFIENSILHGLSGKTEDGLLNISISTENDLLLIFLEDNGVGIDAAAEKQPTTSHKSMGMTITKNRIRLFNQQYQTHAIMNVSALQPGTRIELTFPIVKAF